MSRQRNKLGSRGRQVHGPRGPSRKKTAGRPVRTQASRFFGFFGSSGVRICIIGVHLCASVAKSLPGFATVSPFRPSWLEIRRSTSQNRALLSAVAYLRSVPSIRHSNHSCRIVRFVVAEVLSAPGPSPSRPPCTPANLRLCGEKEHAEHPHSHPHVNDDTRGGNGQTVCPFASEAAGALKEGLRQRDGNGVTVTKNVEGDDGKAAFFGLEANVGTVQMKPKHGIKSRGRIPGNEGR